MSITVRAPGKINPTLEIVGKDAQGWFQLQLSWQKIALADEVTVELRPQLSGLELSCSHPKVPQGPTQKANNCTRGIELLNAWICERDPGFQMPGLRVHIEKRLPLCGGLGGSSTDVAATVRGLAQLLDLNIPPLELNQLMAQVGHDCPFFAQDEPLCLGREKTESGVEMQALPPLDCHVLLVCSSIEMTAVEAYKSFPYTERRSMGPTRSQQMAEAQHKGLPLEQLAPLFCNDLEQSCGGIENHDVLGPALSAMREAGCLNAHLSGSGSTLFGLVSSQSEGERIATRLQGQLAPELTVVLSKTEAQAAAKNALN